MSDDLTGDLFGQPPAPAPAPEPVVAEPPAVVAPTEEPAETFVAQVGATEKTGGQLNMFGEWWEPAWRGMPEFVQPSAMPFRTIHVHFEDQAAVEDFMRLIGQKFTPQTKYVWHPQLEFGKFTHMRYVDEGAVSKPAADELGGVDAVEPSDFEAHPEAE